MRDFYRADQREEESIPSFATRMEGLLSQIRDKFPEKFTHSEEQKLLKDRLFHGCRKTIRDSVKYCFSDPQVDYMQFLEECRKVEDEDKVGQVKINPPKAKVAVATVPPTRDDELAKQLRYQQHQIDTLVGQSKPWCQLLKLQGLLPEGLPQVGQDCLRLHGEEVQGGIPLEPLPNLGAEIPRYIKGLVQIIDVSSVENWGI